MPPGRATVLPLALALLTAAGAPAPAAPDGQAIFEHGEGVVAQVAEGGVRLRPGTLGCAGCHGSDGRGGGEGSTRAPTITWPVLSARAPDRPAYDADALRRALATGVNPAGRTLDRRMPRFDLDTATFAALLAHLRNVDVAGTAGIGPARLTVALPEHPGDRVAVLAALADFNAAGGAFGRHVEPAAPGGDAFLDFEALLPGLRTRLQAAQSGRLAGMMKAEPGFLFQGAADRPPVGSLVYSDAATAGPEFVSLLSEAREMVLVGPRETALAWARRKSLGAREAETRALADFALEALRGPGRRITHVAYARLLAQARIEEIVEVYVYKKEK